MQLDLVVSSLPIASLVPYAENARTHSPTQVAQIAASIAEFGFVNPVLVDAEGVLMIAGLPWRRMGWTPRWASCMRIGRGGPGWPWT